MGVLCKYRSGPYTFWAASVILPSGTLGALLGRNRGDNLLKRRCENRTTGLTSLIWKLEILNALKSQNAELRHDVLSETLHSPSHMAHVAHISWAEIQMQTHRVWYGNVVSQWQGHTLRQGATVCLDADRDGDEYNGPRQHLHLTEMRLCNMAVQSSHYVYEVNQNQCI